VRQQLERAFLFHWPSLTVAVVSFVLWSRLIIVFSITSFLAFVDVSSCPLSSSIL
jgi:hypothetical protein